MIGLAVNIGRGGSGKTTVAVNLAAALARRGKRRVLLLDLDPQGDSTRWLIGDPPAGTLSIADVLEVKAAAKRAIIRAREQLDLIPATADSAERLAVFDHGSAADNTLARLTSPLLAEYDYVLADTPPSQYSALARCAMRALGGLIVPLRFDAMSAGKVAQVARIADATGAAIRLVVCNDSNPQRTLTQDVAAQLAASWPVAKTRIRTCAQLATAYAAGETIFEHAWRCAGAGDFAYLAREVRHVTR